MALKGHDHVFNILEFETVGEAQLLNTFANILGKQVCNGISVQIFNQVTSSYYTNTVSVASSSLFTYAGTTGSLMAASTVLDNLEIPQGDRYSILSPAAYQGLVSSNNFFATYNWGDPRLVRDNGYKSTTNSAWPGVNIAGFNVFKHARVNANTALTPYGGDKYTGTQTLAGWAGNRAGIVFAARAPQTMQVPGVYSYVGVEPTSGLPFLFGAALDIAKPAWRFFIYSLFGVAQGNKYAIVPIVSQST